MTKNLSSVYVKAGLIKLFYSESKATVMKKSQCKQKSRSLIDAKNSCKIDIELMTALTLLLEC